MAEGVYRLPYHCGNCEHSFQAEIPRGTLAAETVKCPNCGCKAAHRAERNAERRWEDDLPVILPTRPVRRFNPDRPIIIRERRPNPFPMRPTYWCEAVAPMRGGYGGGAR